MLPRSPLTIVPHGSGTQRRAGRVTLWAFGLVAISVMLVPTVLWGLFGWSSGEAIALFACLCLLSGMALHIADHVADFLASEPPASDDQV